MYLKENAITPPVEMDWDGKQLKAEFRFILQVEAEAITFGAQFPENCLALGKPQQFTEGLWEASVVELFIHDELSSKYVEINLSPTGAFWIAEFSQYRKGENELRLNPEIETKTSDGATTVLLQISSKEFSLSKFKLSQTAVLYLGDQSSKEEIYLTRKFAKGQSAFDALNCEPDFHIKKLAEVF